MSASCASKWCSHITTRFKSMQQWARIRRSAQTNTPQEQCIEPCTKSETLPESAWQTPYARGIERTARAHHHRSARAPRRYLDGRDDVEVCASDHRHPVDRRDDVTRAQPSTSSQRPLLHRHNRRTVAKGATGDERDADPLVVLQNEERGVVGVVVGVHEERRERVL